jgi:hypothetical protein
VIGKPLTDFGFAKIPLSRKEAVSKVEFLTKI